MDLEITFFSILTKFFFFFHFFFTNLNVNQKNHRNGEKPFWLACNKVLKAIKALITTPPHVCKEVTWYRFSWQSPSYWNVQILTWTIKPLFSTSIQPPLIQWVIHSCGNLVNPKRKDAALFADSILKDMRMKNLNSRVKRWEKTPNIVPWCQSWSTEPLHYTNIRRVQVWLCNYSYLYQWQSLEKNDTDMNNLPDSILEIENTCHNYNIDKIFISAIL